MRKAIQNDAHPAIPFLRVLTFGLLTATIAVLLSLAAKPFVDFSLWKIFRRCVSIGAALSLVVLLLAEGRSLRDLGLTSWKDGRADFGLGAALGGAVVLILLVLGFAFNRCMVSLHPDHVKVWRTLIGFVPGAVLVAFLEELIFRGYLFRNLQRYSNVLAVFATAILYSAVHLKSGKWDPLLWRELFGLALLGVVLAYTCLWRGRLYMAVGLHAVLAYAARVNKLVIAIPDSSLTWVTGTSRLVNGAASWVVLLFALLVIYRWSHRSEMTKGRE